MVLSAPIQEWQRIYVVGERGNCLDMRSWLASGSVNMRESPMDMTGGSASGRPAAASLALEAVSFVTAFSFGVDFRSQSPCG